MSYVRAARGSTRKRRNKRRVGSLLRGRAMCSYCDESWVVALSSRHEAQEKEEEESPAW